MLSSPPDLYTLKNESSQVHSPPLSLHLSLSGILTLPVQFWLAALCRDAGTVRENIRSLSGTQVCQGKSVKFCHYSCNSAFYVLLGKGSRKATARTSPDGCGQRCRRRLSRSHLSSFLCPWRMLNVKQTFYRPC